MKKFYPWCLLFSVLGMCSFLWSSCSDDGGDDTPPPGGGENSFVYEGAESKIGSVVYQVDETGKTYTFYFSPTEGLLDLDAMLLADDYIKIETDTPTGDIDLLAEGNSLLYKKVDISAASADNTAKSTLSLQLTSLTTVKMTLDAAMKSGETLTASYNGTCSRHSEQSGQGEGIVLDTPVFSWWLGSEKPASGANDYYIAVTDAPYTIQSGVQAALTEPGYMLVIDCYLDSGEKWKTFPTGVFNESPGLEDHTYSFDNSFVLYFDGTNYNQMHLSGPITISRDAQNIAKISTTFLDEDGIVGEAGTEYPISFEGDLRVGNGRTLPTMPHLMHDIEFKGVYAQGVYSGDVYDTGGGMIEMTFYDEKGDAGEPFGYAVKLTVIGPKFLDPKKERKLTPGTYTAATTYKKDTWMPAAEMTILGMVIPMGTYAAYDDQTQNGQYSYGSEGTIEIEELANNRHRVTFEIEAQTGYVFKGSFEGDIPLEDQSDDSEDDGSSTLTEDLDMDLSYLEKAHCFPQTQIFVPGLGTIDVADLTTVTPPAPEACGYQFIDLGLATGTYKHDPTGEYNDPGKLVEGDIVRLDLLVEPGDEGKITPGTYTLSPNRYPAQMRPGVALRGYQGGEGHIGTRWLGIGSAIGNGYPKYHSDPDHIVIDGWLNIASMKGYASIYEGTVTITKAEGGENWVTFEVDGEDVLHHSITGTWTGPVVLGDGVTPVVSSGKEFKPAAAAAPEAKPASEKQRFPTMRDAADSKPAQALPARRLSLR